MAISERLAKADPSNAEAQRDLFRSHLRFAQTAFKANDKVGTIKQFEMAEAVFVDLLARVGDNANVQRDLAGVRRLLAQLRAQ